jgi:hypothetical protein
MKFNTLPIAALLSSSVSAAVVNDLFSVSGPKVGMCATPKNAHPLAYAMDAQALAGQWKTILIDAAMTESGSECHTAEFVPLEGGNIAFKVNELSRLVPATDKFDEKKAKIFVQGTVSTLSNLRDDVPESEQDKLPNFMYNQFNFGPSNKFTSLIDVSSIFADEETRKLLDDRLIATVTCVQTQMPAPAEYIKQRIEDVEKMTGQKLKAEEIMPAEAL